MFEKKKGGEGRKERSALSLPPPLRVFNKILNRCESFGVGRVRTKKLAAMARVFGKILKSRSLRMNFQHSGVKIRVLEQKTNIIKFWLFYLVTPHEYSI